MLQYGVQRVFHCVLYHKDAPATGATSRIGATGQGQLDGACNVHMRHGFLRSYGVQRVLQCASYDKGAPAIGATSTIGATGETGQGQFDGHVQVHMKRDESIVAPATGAKDSRLIRCVLATGETG